MGRDLDLDLDFDFDVGDGCWRWGCWVAFLVMGGGRHIVSDFRSERQ